jgi:hypothetical protein
MEINKTSLHVFRARICGAALATLAAVVLVVVQHSDNAVVRPSLLQQHHPAKAAAHSRLAEMALRKVSQINEVPSALKALDPVARTVSLSEDDRIIAEARKEVLAAQHKIAHMSLFEVKRTMKDALKRDEKMKKKDHFGVVYSGASAPVSLKGRVMALATDPTAINHAVSKAAAELWGSGNTMKLADHQEKKLEKTQELAAVRIKKFAKTLLASQRKAAAELHDLEKHFG